MLLYLYKHTTIYPRLNTHTYFRKTTLLNYAASLKTKSQRSEMFSTRSMKANDRMTYLRINVPCHHEAQLVPRLLSEYLKLNHIALTTSPDVTTSGRLPATRHPGARQMPGRR